MMRYGVPTIGDRVAPRCTYADGFVVIDTQKGVITFQRQFKTTIRTVADLTETLAMHNVETMIAGGVGETVTDRLRELNIKVMKDVSHTVSELPDSIFSGGATLSRDKEERNDRTHAPLPCVSDRNMADVDCISCADRTCIEGKTVGMAPLSIWDGLNATERRIVEAALDISNESPRRLCRLAEVIYFCLEMGYRRIGLAYCIELEDAAEILANVFRRFFNVVPVCCKVGGIKETALYSDESTWQEVDTAKIVCNPLGQAHVLNRAETDFNVVVGLCVGMDSLFFRAAGAPSTALLVKDKSLANNPIGALYSEYYLKETVLGAPRRQGLTHNPSEEK